MTIGTRLFTYFRGRAVGTDATGNRYFEEKRARRGLRARRWVLFNGETEATLVPPERDAWLHFTTKEPIPLSARKAWQKPHQPNMTGTPGAYRPPGHDYRGGQRPHATGDYESWTPGS